MSMLSEAGNGRLETATSDVGIARERARGRRLLHLAGILAIPLAWLWWRVVSGDPFDPFDMALPQIDPFLLIVGVFFAVMIFTMLGMTVFAGRSPHVTYRPEQIDVHLSDVKGIDLVKADVIRSLNLFLANRSFRAEMGGTPRLGLLFEGTPGTGKTHLAKAMAAESGVPFLFVSATSFQSMYYGATARKIRSYFKALRKAARQEGGAIGFIWHNRRDGRVVGRPGGMYPDATAKHGDHWEREGKLYLIKDSWAVSRKMLKKVDGVEYDISLNDGKPGIPIGCRCWAEYIYAIELIPEKYRDCITAKGMEYMK